MFVVFMNAAAQAFERPRRWMGQVLQAPMPASSAWRERTRAHQVCSASTHTLMAEANVLIITASSVPLVCACCQLDKHLMTVICAVLAFCQILAIAWISQRQRRNCSDLMRSPLQEPRLPPTAHRAHQGHTALPRVCARTQYA